MSCCVAELHLPVAPSTTTSTQPPRHTHDSGKHRGRKGQGKQPAHSKDKDKDQGKQQQQASRRKHDEQGTVPVMSTACHFGSGGRWARFGFAVRPRCCDVGSGFRGADVVHGSAAAAAAAATAAAARR